MLMISISKKISQEIKGLIQFPCFYNFLLFKKNISQVEIIALTNSKIKVNIIYLAYLAKLDVLV